MDGLSEPQIAAILLILSGIVFVVGGVLYTGRAIWKWSVGQTSAYLRWERSFVIAAVLINLMGMALLEAMLGDAGDSVIARLAMTIYLLSAVVVVVAETSFLSSGQWLYAQIVLYVILAFLAQAAFGVALLRTGLVASWAGWATIIWNLGWLILLPIFSPRELYYPVLHHAAPLMIGIALLAK